MSVVTQFLQNSSTDLFVWSEARGHALPTAVDLGFPIGWGANSPGAPTHDFAKFSKKLHEIKKILGCGRPRRSGRRGASRSSNSLKGGLNVTADSCLDMSSRTLAQNVRDQGLIPH